VAGGEAAGAWVSAHIDDPSCAGASRDCQATIGSLALTLQVGVDGGRQLDIAAASSP
jgi:hypothetical protein